MSRWTRARTRRGLFAALNAAGLAALLVLGTGTALADPDPAPGDPGTVAAPQNGGDAPAPAAVPAPEPLAIPTFGGSADGQNPTPFTGVAPFGPPKFVPANGATVGVAQPIIINFPGAGRRRGRRQ